MLDNTDWTPAKLMTAPQLAAYLSTSVSTVRRMTRDELVPVVRIRSLVRYDPVAVVRALTCDDDDEDCCSVAR